MITPSTSPVAPARVHSIPPKTGVIGMSWFLASLTMLFLAMMLGYLLIIFFAHSPRESMNDDGQIVMVQPVIPDIHLPMILWASTAVMLLSSYTIHQALRNIQWERQRPTRLWLVATLVLAGLFIVIQTPSLVVLFNEHLAVRKELGIALLGLIIALIVIHAAHVLGGIIPLAIVTRKAFAGNYDHERHGPIKYVTMYWHFLDVVWLVMFVTLMATT